MTAICSVCKKTIKSDVHTIVQPSGHTRKFHLECLNESEQTRIRKERLKLTVHDGLKPL